MGIRQHGRGWQARVYADGVRTCRTFADRDDAAAWLREQHDRIDRARLDADPELQRARARLEALRRTLRG